MNRPNQAEERLSGMFKELLHVDNIKDKSKQP
jgi:hypothetical protein